MLTLTASIMYFCLQQQGEGPDDNDLASEVSRLSVDGSVSDPSPQAED